MDIDLYPQLKDTHWIEFQLHGAATVFAAFEHGRGENEGLEKYFDEDGWQLEIGEIVTTGVKLNRIFSLRFDHAVTGFIFPDSNSTETPMLILAVSHCTGEYQQYYVDRKLEAT